MPIRLRSSFHSPARARRVRYGACGVLEHAGMFIAAGPEAVFQDKPGDTFLVKKPGVVFAFVAGQAAVAAAGTDHDRGTVSFAFFRQIGCQGGDIFISLPRAPGAPSGQRGKDSAAYTGERAERAATAAVAKRSNFIGGIAYPYHDEAKSRK